LAVAIAPADEPVREFPASRVHVLAIGINRYLEIKVPLSEAERDIRDVGSAFRRARVRNIRLLLGSEGPVTDEVIRRELKNVSAQMSPRDLLIVIFAGHGFTHQGRQYLAPFNVRITRETLAVTSIAVDELMSSIRSSGVTYTLAIFDSCRDEPFPAAPEPRDLINEAQANAAGSQSKAFEIPGYGGLFLRPFIEAIEGPARDADGRISLKQAIHYATARARTRAAAGNKIQHPEINLRGDWQHTEIRIVPWELSSSDATGPADTTLRPAPTLKRGRRDPIRWKR
jgi:uncharacterized caspase-like protein